MLPLTPLCYAIVTWKFQLCCITLVRIRHGGKVGKYCQVFMSLVAVCHRLTLVEIMYEQVLSTSQTAVLKYSDTSHKPGSH